MVAMSNGSTADVSTDMTDERQRTRNRVLDCLTAFTFSYGFSDARHFKL